MSEKIFKKIDKKLNDENMLLQLLVVQIHQTLYFC